MQTSKNHFEAKVIFNDETIRRMFRTEFYTYEGMQRLVWLAVAFALVMLALFVPIPTVVKVLCLLVGCAMFAMPDFLSRVAAEGVIMQRGGDESTVSCQRQPAAGEPRAVCQGACQRNRQGLAAAQEPVGPQPERSDPDGERSAPPRRVLTAAFQICCFTADRL